MECKNVAKGDDEDPQCLEYKMVETDGCEVMEGGVGKGLDTGGHVYLDKKTQIYTCDLETLGSDVL